ncbi:hypothetical protein GJR96_15665 [Haloferax sp. MBLA0076]|uniref:Uncharacterized protein n=1 Tax=Haloferax litoreum TaxID=2666140 RepID=A0A6A8GKL4_9EURY|nr:MULTISPECIES: DUF5518 domain-containing protein [Haloferax]KAB1190415.1 hypothetical protein Hfx1148_15595 [Haloferax sp. CBA1148]MRX23389.1 hypothetical protein [Haloferax litoreum]
MPLHTRIYRELTEPELRLATAIGLVSALLTVPLSWRTVTDESLVAGGTVSGGVFIVAGFLVGYLYYGRPTSRRRASTRTGLAASIGVVVVYLATMFSTLTVSSLRTALFTVVGTPIAIVLGVAIVVLFVRVAAFIGDRLAAVRSWRTEVKDTTNEDWRGTSGSKWPKYVVLYVFVVPVTAGYFFGLRPQSGVGILFGVLLLLVTYIAAILLLVAVYKDAKQLYENNSPWVPNVVAYVGAPVAAFMLGYYAAVLNAWDAPVETLSFLGVCWLAATFYLLDRKRSVGAV